MAHGQQAQTTRIGGLKAITLSCADAEIETTWVPGAGMLGASLVYHGEEMLWQGAGVRAYARERRFMGIPFLHPWANRLSGFAYRADGRDVRLDPASKLLLLDDHGLPIHGVLNAARGWAVTDLGADDDCAWMTASLSFDRPELLAAFPFAHRIELEVQLSGGAVQVRTTLAATGREAIPIAFGFHPYLRIPGVPRARWEVAFPVSRRLLLDHHQIPTGATEPVRPLTGTIGQRTWDDGFDRIDPLAWFELRGGGRTIAVEYTHGYPVAQIFAPPGQEYVCIEPMTAPANALSGPDDRLAWVPVGEQRSASFRIACRLDP
ncbi:MAG: aldose 1-epimerase [Solirubrobacterales bacterium]|nr:aldose 1-epimerase [Solirubrobacterales bacterium]